MSIKYKLTEFLFRHTVKPMMKKAIKNPDEYFAKQEKKQKSKLPLEKLHKSSVPEILSVPIHFLA